MSTEYAREIQKDISQRRTALSKVEQTAREIDELSLAINLIDRGEPMKLAYPKQDRTQVFTVEQMPYLFKMLLQDQITKKRAEIDELMKGLG